MIRWLRRLLLCGLFPLGACQGLPPVEHASMPDYTRQILVTFEQPIPAPRAVLGPKSHYHLREDWRAPLHLRTRIDRLASAHALVELDGWPIASLNRYCVLFGVKPGGERPRLLSTLSAHPGVDMVQPLNRFYGLLAYDDPYVGLQYGDRTAALYTLHQFTRGDDIRVGLIDSAVDGGHPDLAGQLRRQRIFVPADSPRERLHGTAVAGVIAARDNNGEGGVGLAPEVHLFSYGACGSQDRRTICNSFDLARALEEAIHDDVQVLNLSLAGPHDPLLAALLMHLLDRGAIVVASNNGSDAGNNFPASLPGVVAAGRGPEASAGDSGLLREELLSTRAGGGYQYFYGSSIASAGASGLAALARSRMDVEHARALLLRLAANDCAELAAQGASGFERAVGVAVGCLPTEPGLPAAYPVAAGAGSRVAFWRRGNAY